jgi:GNAT superfamily N-acetyltransferase
MAIEQADWKDILEVLHETEKIWSVGLSKDHYQRYIFQQLNHPWGRRHFHYIVCRKNERIVASCKFYDLLYTARGKTYRFAGLGAIYTKEAFRGKGYATELMQHMISLAESDNLDGIILFSDIGAEFYQSFGFLEFGSANFSIELPISKDVEGFPNRKEPRHRHVSYFNHLGKHNIGFVERHYMRWLRTQPFGIVRTSDYWSYKVSEEEFLHHYSKLSWPQLWLISVDEDYAKAGYAIIEYGGTTLRVLELIGAQEAKIPLWQNIFKSAGQLGATRIRGWESLLRGLEPGFSIRNLVPEDIYPNFNEPVRYSERDWGRPMILPLNPETEKWTQAFPCPILELDHL